MATHIFTSKNALIVVLLLSVLIGAGGTAMAAGSSPSVGHVYTMTNDPAGNAVVVFNRAADGTLTKSRTFPTGGTSIGLFATGNQNGVILDEDGHCLWAVNSLSNDITAFQVVGNSLSFVNKVDSGGLRPISLTEYKPKSLLYVLNAGGQLDDEMKCVNHKKDGKDCKDNITGFTVDQRCKLSPLAGSTQPLSGPSTSPAQVGFSPNGRVLVVTEKTTNMITTYTVGKDGLPSAPMPQPSQVHEPFGFTFINRGQLLVAEAACSVPRLPGNIPGCSVPPDQPALSSYEVADDGTLTPIDSEPTGQAASCWVVATNSQRFAYTTNALAQFSPPPNLRAGSVSSFSIDPDGNLTLLSSTIEEIGPVGVPIDAALSNNSRFLYVLREADGIINAYQVEADGGLTFLGIANITRNPPFPTCPETANCPVPFPNGLAAR